MSVQTRPTDAITVDYLQLGMPFVEFAPLNTSSGAYGPYRSLGIIRDFEIAKTLDVAPLESSQSGRQVLIREIVQRQGATFNVGLYQHSPDNLQLMLASSVLTSVSGGNTVVTEEQFQLTDDEGDFLDLDHGNIDESTIANVTAAPVLLEAVGTGQGTPYGETKGDFALDFKVNATSDLSVFTVGGVDKTGSLVTGAPTGSGEIGLFVGATADSGQFQWYTGEGPASGSAIVASYEPGFTALVAGTGYYADGKQGRIRVLDVGGSTDAFKAFQWMEVNYTYAAVAHSELKPFTQYVFEGRARIRLLTDVGINIIWNIPKCSIRLTDDALTFTRDEPGVTNLAITLLDDGTSTPYGTLELYQET